MYDIFIVDSNLQNEEARNEWWVLACAQIDGRIVYSIERDIILCMSGAH